MKRGWILLCLVLVIGSAGVANGALWDRGGGLIYDDVLNITWLQDANYARTSGYDDDGRMQWNQAAEWADGLSYYDSVRGVTWTDWRLPDTGPVNGQLFNFETTSRDGSTDLGHNIGAPGTIYAGSTGSEMAFMFYINLGNLGQYDLDGTLRPDGEWGLLNTGFQSGGFGGPEVFFENIRKGGYWSGTEYPPDTDYAIWFNINAGAQRASDKDDFLYAAWAVRDGDVAAVPVPGTVLLLASGLAGLAAFRKRFRKS